MSDQLRVPKRRAQVEVLLPGGAARQVTVFLSEFASRHNGPERLSDLFNASEDFVPALDVLSDTMTFLNRHGIAAARVAREWELGEEAPAGEQHEVEIALVDGTTLRGTVTVVLPPGRTRLLDFLNDAQPFLRLDEKERVALVNKRHIARVAKVK
ncbi:MAG: hypothetical protein LC689_06410 [Myxococcales bacterium]|nr:hypothetical protein [Myxococcales bacterium]